MTIGSVKQYTYDENNRLISSNDGHQTTTYAYDANGNMLRSDGEKQQIISLTPNMIMIRSESFKMMKMNGFNYSMQLKPLMIGMEQCAQQIQCILVFIGQTAH